MSLFSDLSPNGRRNALAVVMLALLGVALGAAYLTARWSERPLEGESWLLITDDAGEIVGWRCLRRDRDDQWLVGHDMESYGVDGRSAAAIIEQWRLHEDRTQGRYVAAVPTVIQNQQRDQLTHIGLDGDVIEIVLSIEGGRTARRVRLARPENYIPEGALIEEIAEAAQTQKTFRGQMVINDTASLEPVTIQPLGPRPLTNNGQELSLQFVRVIIGRQDPDDPHQYREVGLDQAGQIVVSEVYAGGQLDRRYRLVDESRVTDLFPDARSVRAGAIRRVE